MSLKGKSLYVLTPMYGGQLSVNYHNSFQALLHQCHRYQINFGSANVYNESLIPRARNRLVDTYLKEQDHTNCVFIDADIGFDPMDILAMLESDHDIVGVPCSKKAIRWDRIQIAVARRAFEWKRDHGNGEVDPRALTKEFVRSGKEIQMNEFPKIAGDFVLNFPQFDGMKTLRMDQLEEMRNLGTGVMMIKRSVFEKFKKCYPDRWYKAPANDKTALPGAIHDFFKCGVNPETREYDSEDYWFCRDCIAIGYKVMMMPSVKTTHMGAYTFVGDMAAALAYTGEIY